MNISIIVFIVGLSMVACISKPKVTESDPIDGGPVGRIESPNDLTVDQDERLQEHMVKVEEVLNTDRYTYLNVTENGNKFWIAIPRKEIEIGGTYYYRGGLLKRNFPSKEFNRVFDTIYLVADVIPNSTNSGMPIEEEGMTNQEIHTHEAINVEPTEGTVKISSIFSDPSKYQGKQVKVTGKCVKVNPMIMGRNWVHIQDGSGDNLDLTVTTADNIPLGAIVSLEGIIALDKDFGAGYRYDIIMEKAILK